MIHASAQRELGHHQRELRTFLRTYKRVFTRRRDGTTWSKWRNTWRTANRYVQGLLVPGNSKNMRRIATHVGLDEDRIERFIRERPWDYETLQHDLVHNIPKAIQSPRAAIVIDDYAVAKKGTHSVGVARQYSGLKGTTDSVQVAVNLTYACPGEDRNADQATWPLGTRLYLPQHWVEDPAYEELRREVGLPEDTRFKKKQEIAADLLQRALDARVPHAVVVADAGYGRDADLRRRLREQRQPYVMGLAKTWPKFVAADAPVQPPGNRGQARWHYSHVDWSVPRQAPDEIAAQIQDWKEVEWGRGTKGPLTAKFARVRIRALDGRPKLARASDEVGWLLFERSTHKQNVYICWGLDDASLDDLVQFAHMRWTIEQFHREAKGLIGLDRFEGRSWKGWHHHVSLVLLAYAFLSQHRAQSPTGRPPLSTVLSALLLEQSTQDLLEHAKMQRAEARRAADLVLRRAVTWYR